MSNLIEQYAKLKSQYTDVLLLMRVGDFWEAIDGDADILARVCRLAKTTRADHRMAGFPHMQLGHFLTALVGAGFRVATCEPVGNSLPGNSPPGNSLPGKPEVIHHPSEKEGHA